MGLRAAGRPAKRRAVGLLGIQQADSSEDEDYQPGGTSRPPSAAGAPPSHVADEDMLLSQRRRQLNAQQQQQGTAFATQGRAQAASSGGGSAPRQLTPVLPEDVVSIILRMACAPAAGGAIPTAAAAACVCRAWREAALACPDLWSHVDLSWPRCRPTDAALARITPRWSGLKVLRVAPGAAGTAGMSGAGLRLVAAHCPVLTSLSLAHCAQFSEADVCAALTQMLQRPATADSKPLTHLDLSFTEISPKVSGLDSVVRTVLSQQAGNGGGPVLQEFIVEGCPVLSHRGLRAVTEASVELATPLLAALQILDLSQSASAKPGFTINLERLQYSAPGLQQLRLNSLCGAYGWSTNPNPSRLPRDAPPPGFRHLRVCQVAAKPRQSLSGAGAIGSYVTNACLIRLLAHAAQLEELDVSCCDRLSPDSLAIAIHPDAPLKHALLSRSGACCDEVVEFLVERFGPSLEAVDLSWGASRITDAAAIALAHCPRLHSVGLEGTAVSSEGVRQLLQAADMHASEAACASGGSQGSGSGRPPFSVDVGSCRGLERGVRQAATLGMDQLREALKV